MLTKNAIQVKSPFLPLLKNVRIRIVTEPDSGTLIAQKESWICAAMPAADKKVRRR
jgi:hypothetical protein